MKIRLNEVNGCCVWAADDYKPAYQALDMADNGDIEGNTNWQHGRTVFLETPGRQTIAAKGVGWTHNWVPGWCPEMGSFGILPLRAAIHEKDISLYLAKYGIACAKPLAIFQKLEIRSKSGKLIGSDTVPDLDGTPAKPSVYYYYTESTVRCSELRMMDIENNTIISDLLSRLQCNDIEEYIGFLCGKMASSSAIFHTHGGHNYSASSHNITLLGEILDFEYAVVDKVHWKNELREQQETWRDKELDGWVILLAEVMDCLNYKGERRIVLHDFIRLYLELGGDANLPTCRMVL